MTAPDGRPLKVPEIGWNQLRLAATDPLLEGIEDGSHAYFVHSYYCQPEGESYTLASTDYGITYTSVVRRKNLWGIQCHPEKSQLVGLSILRNFVEVVNRWP
jgi:glutamine amidotransferase